MPHTKNKIKRKSRLWLIPLALFALALLLSAMFYGNNVALLNPKGQIALDQSRLIYTTITILLTIAIPSVSLLFFTAWNFRESNQRAVYAPETHHGKFFVITIWLIPTLIMLKLSFILWSATHTLIPQQAVASNKKPFVIQVVSLRWKWLFIYPQQNIATVNYAQIPLHTPVEFDLTADETPMSSFWIPNLGGQLYAMTGMVNKLNLIADTPGDYPGSSAEINGAGFAGMQFTARASSDEAFKNWVIGIKKSNKKLDDSSYAKLLMPSEYNPPAFYASSETGLYDKVLMKYMAPMNGNHTTEHTDGGMQMMGQMNMGHMNDQ